MPQKFLILLLLILSQTALATKEENDLLQADQDKFDVPASGDLRLSGKISQGPSPDEFLIGEKPFKFTAPQPVNGTNFDNESRRGLIGQEIDAFFVREPGALMLTAAIPSNLFSSRSAEPAPSATLHFKNSFASPGHFVSDAEATVFKEYANYRTTLFSKTEVKAGDVALLISFSNGQGDDRSAIIGHFAFGRATVQADGRLDGKMGSFYPAVNEKNLIPGFLKIEDYFGNLTSGQSQFRSTSTLIVYGLDDIAIQKAIVKMGTTFKYLREHRDVVALASFNCTSESCRALRSSDLDVNEHPQSRAPLPISALGKLFADTGAESWMWRRFFFFLFTNTAEILPRLAFENAMSSLLKDQTVGLEKATRADYVFQGQIPSARARGLLAPAGIIDYLKDNLFYGAPRSANTPLK